MQKNKRYILAAAVVLVWAIVIYKIADIIFSEEVTDPIISQPVKPIEKKILQQDYTLQLNYDDPFLGYYYKSQVIEEETEFIDIFVEPLNWPEIKYKGSISHKGQVKAIIEVGEMIKSVKRGEIFDGLQVIIISSDSIIIKHKTEKQTFFRSL